MSILTTREIEIIRSQYKLDENPPCSTWSLLQQKNITNYNHQTRNNTFLNWIDNSDEALQIRTLLNDSDIIKLEYLIEILGMGQGIVDRSLVSKLNLYPVSNSSRRTILMEYIYLARWYGVTDNSTFIDLIRDYA